MVLVSARLGTLPPILRAEHSMSMAMSDDGSSLAQWPVLYTHEPSPGLSLGHADGGAAESNIVAAAAPSTSPTSAGSGGSPTRALTGVEGPRVGKLAKRRRSRASRRAPVTLINTDTANFRAMVQQFTGIPEPNLFAGSDSVPVINFVADYGFPPPAEVMSFDHLNQRQQLFQDHLLRPQQYTGATFGYSNLQADAGGSHRDVFAHGLDSAEDRMLLQSMQAAQMPASTANHSANGYFA